MQDPSGCYSGEESPRTETYTWMWVVMFTSQYNLWYWLSQVMLPGVLSHEDGSVELGMTYLSKTITMNRSAGLLAGRSRA